MSRTIRLPLILSVALAGCATAMQPQSPWPEDPLYDAPPPAANPDVDEWGGYLFRDSNLYRGSKAGRRGDHVLVRVLHSVTGDSKATTSLSRESESEAGISAMLGLETMIPQLLPGVSPTASIKGNSSNGFTGQGGTNRLGMLRTDVTAKVLSVLPNGYLEIGARQQVKINNEVDILWLYGVVDPSLIGVDNSISSRNIADLRMEYSGMGVIAGKQRPGWLSRVLDIVQPL
jgi:flagellar L-ring protein precursor FlgH